MNYILFEFGGSMTPEDAIELLIGKSGCSFFTKGYFFCTTFVESKTRMDILREIADAMTKKLVSVSEDELQEGRFIFWGSTYEEFFHLLFVKYSEIEMFLNFIDEKSDSLDNFQVA